MRSLPFLLLTAIAIAQAPAPAPNPIPLNGISPNQACLESCKAAGRIVLLCVASDAPTNKDPSADGRCSACARPGGGCGEEYAYIKSPVVGTILKDETVEFEWTDGGVATVSTQLIVGTREQWSDIYTGPPSRPDPTTGTNKARVPKIPGGTRVYVTVYCSTNTGKRFGMLYTYETKDEAGLVEAPMKANTSFDGAMLRAYSIAEPDPASCRTGCLGDSQCQGFTYSRPGTRQPTAQCELKSSLTAAKTDTCCVSWTRPGVPAPPLSSTSPPPPPTLPPTTTTPPGPVTTNPPGGPGVPPPATPPTRTPTSLAGTWYRDGDRSRPIAVIHSSQFLSFANEAGQISRGRFEGRDLIASDWGGLRGQVAPDEMRIQWSNGMVWQRLSAGATVPTGGIPPPPPPPVTPPPAPATPVQRLTTIQVQASVPWTDTGIDVFPGMRIAISAGGTVNLGPGRAGNVNGTLVAKIVYRAGGESNVVGVSASDLITVDPNENGRLFLGISDSDFSDNSGQFTVHLRR